MDGRRWKGDGGAVLRTCETEDRDAGLDDDDGEPALHLVADVGADGEESDRDHVWRCAVQVGL